MTNGSAPSPAASSQAAKKRKTINGPALLALSYIFTVTVFLQIKVTNDTSFADNEPFLTHHDLLDNDDGSRPRSLSSSSIPQQQQSSSCSGNVFHTLSNVIAKINEDPNNNALVPLDIPAVTSNSNTTIKNGMMNMPGLHLDSFKGKHIALLGDSTLFYPAKYLVSILRHADTAPGGSVEYHKMKMGQANNFVLATKQFMLKGIASPPPYKSDDGTWFQWYGMQGNSHGRTEEFIDSMFIEAEKMRPDVVVANMAFHWFHLCGYSEKMCPTPKDSPLISRWLHYKETWLQRVHDFAIKVNAKVLLFKTANFICQSARTGDWAIGDALYQKFDNATISGCVKRLEPLGKDLFLENEDIYKYCKYAQFTDVGSQYLNQQMVDFVRNIQKDSGDPKGGPIVGIYNDHDVESCSTTEDAIHHKIGITCRLRLLANTIDSYLKCFKP
ncbi:hypothetical protein ACHAXR_003821 [Thalassiosira sp. AJA248-18]